MSHFGRSQRAAIVLGVAACFWSACSKPAPGAESPEALEALGPADASVAPVIVESTAAGSEPALPPNTPPSSPAPSSSVPSSSVPSSPAPSAPAVPGQAEPASDAPIVQTLFVREQPASCEAEGTRQCLMVRSSEGEDWRLFYADIEGFSYQPSYVYELRVAVSPVAGPAADAPSLRYALVEVVSKKKRP